MRKRGKANRIWDGWMDGSDNRKPHTCISHVFTYLCCSCFRLYDVYIPPGTVPVVRLILLDLENERPV